MFEAGLFMGMHGKRNTFIVVPRGVPSFHLASDFLGITTATYDSSFAKQNAPNAMAPTVSKIRQALPDASESKDIEPSAKNRIEIKTHFSPPYPATALIFPLKFYLMFKNPEPITAIIESRGFEFGRDILPSPRAKLTAAGRYNFQFYKGNDPASKKEIWEDRCVLEQGTMSQGWVPLDESLPRGFVEQAAAKREVGKIKFRVVWQSDPIAVEEFEAAV